jgi:hypothetical protein
VIAAIAPIAWRFGIDGIDIKTQYFSFVEAWEAA